MKNPIAEKILRNKFKNSFLDLEYIELYIEAMEEYAQHLLSLSPSNEQEKKPIEENQEFKIINLVHEDDLPEMTDNEYNEWFKTSAVINGVRMGLPFERRNEK